MNEIKIRLRFQSPSAKKPQLPKEIPQKEIPEKKIPELKSPENNESTPETGFDAFVNFKYFGYDCNDLKKENCQKEKKHCQWDKKCLNKSLIIPHTDAYSHMEVKSSTDLKKFIRTWKASNFIRRQKNKWDVIKELGQEGLSLLSSAKLNQPYTLYRCIRKELRPGGDPRGGIHMFSDGYYRDKWPSSWSKNPSVAKRFGNDCMKLKVRPENILVDIDYVRSEPGKSSGGDIVEEEVIVLPGTYPVEIIKI